MPDPVHEGKWKRTDYYYTLAWQVFEERASDNLDSKDTLATAAKAQYLWDIRYIDAPVLRWRDADADPETGDYGLEETLYYCNDANMNVTALVNTSGTVVERYQYDPYGKPSFFDGSWTPRDESAFANEILYCGYRWDPETGLYHVRHRYYHPAVGRWITQDPDMYDDGMNLFQSVLSSPVCRRDPTGKATITVLGPDQPRSELRPGDEAMVTDDLGRQLSASDDFAGPWLPLPPGRAPGEAKLNLVGDPVPPQVRGVLLGKFLVTAYNIAHEADHPAQPQVEAKGLGQKYNPEFLKNIRRQGSGIDRQGRKIQLNWNDRASYRQGAPTSYTYVQHIRTRTASLLEDGVTIAVDPAVISLGSWVYIESIGWRMATDTGGKIKGQHIDLFMATSLSEALKWGRKTLCVWKESS